MKIIEKEREKLLSKPDLPVIDNHSRESEAMESSSSLNFSHEKTIFDDFVNIKVRLQSHKGMEKYRIRKVTQDFAYPNIA